MFVTMQETGNQSYNLQDLTVRDFFAKRGLLDKRTTYSHPPLRHNIKAHLAKA